VVNSQHYGLVNTKQIRWSGKFKFSENVIFCYLLKVREKNAVNLPCFVRLISKGKEFELTDLPSLLILILLRHVPFSTSCSIYKHFVSDKQSRDVLFLYP